MQAIHIAPVYEPAPLPILPHVFLYFLAFTMILAAVLLLVARSRSFRRMQLAILLFPIGLIELSIITFYVAFAYIVPRSIYILCFATIISGIVIPIFYAARRFLSHPLIRIGLFFFGGVVLAFGLNRFAQFWHAYSSPFELFLIAGTATAGIYLIAASVALSATNRNNVERATEYVEERDLQS